MNIYFLSQIGGFTILPAALIGLIRYRKILSAYRPFVIYTWINLLNHSLSFALIPLTGSNTVNGNIYVLIESLLLTWLFHNWGLFKNRRVLQILLLASLVIVWTIDNFILNSIYTINSFFRVYYSMVLVCFAINQVNQTLIEERKSLLLNAQFLICCVIVLYFTYKAIVEVFYLIHLKVSNKFYENVFVVFIIVNIFANIIYALAALWTPTRQKYTLLS